MFPFDEVAVEAAGTAVGENVGNHVASWEVGMVATDDGEGHMEQGGRYVAADGLASLTLHWRLLWYRSVVDIALWYGAEPFFGEADGFFEADVAYNGKDGVVGGVVAVEEVFHVVHRGVGYVVEAKSDGWPTVGVDLICEVCYEVREVAIGLVEIALFEFFHYYLALYFERFGCKGEGEHAVAFEPERRFDV